MDIACLLSEQKKEKRVTSVFWQVPMGLVALK
jgi:hypothetical protein